MFWASAISMKDITWSIQLHKPIGRQVNTTRKQLLDINILMVSYQAGGWQEPLGGWKWCCNSSQEKTTLKGNIGQEFVSGTVLNSMGWFKEMVEAVNTSKQVLEQGTLTLTSRQASIESLN